LKISLLLLLFLAAKAQNFLEIEDDQGSEKQQAEEVFNE
jgi:hypothetical protein